MPVSTLIVLIALFGLMLLILQRTERKRRWVVFLLFLPASVFIYYWAGFRQQLGSALLATGIAAVLNLLFWIFYGQKHPPVSSDESIRVIGMDE